MAEPSSPSDRPPWEMTDEQLKEWFERRQAEPPDPNWTQVTEEESDRLYDLLVDIATFDGALRVLGPPDEDLPEGVGVPLSNSELGDYMERFKRGEVAKLETQRAWKYTKLSETVDVLLCEQRPGGIHFMFTPKYIGPSREGGTQGGAAVPGPSDPL